MPIPVTQGRPTILVRRRSYDGAGVDRAELDARFNLTADEFVVEGGLVAIGPLPNDEMLGDLIEHLESNGLSYFDDFCELSGNWPEWVWLFAMSRDPQQTA